MLLAVSLVHFHLRSDKNIYGKRFKKEKYGETGHREGSRLDSAHDAETVSHHFDDDQKGGRHGSHEEQEYENIQSCVRAIQPTKQVEATPDDEQKQYLG
jgi:hypothetical protein